jgi:hypothetical protein
MHIIRAPVYYSCAVAQTGGTVMVSGTSLHYSTAFAVLAPASTKVVIAPVLLGGLGDVRVGESYANIRSTPSGHPRTSDWQPERL